ncbi:MAG: amino acid ABC transporter substrate-binding protein [Caldilineaceae bacterium]|nr:amino acid ABC transporter substrate-binding protein [Caldilineaceae bacterium]
MSRRQVQLAGITLVVTLAISAVSYLWLQQELPLASFFRRDQTWQAMVNRGTWRVGMDPSFPPFESLDAAGVPVGFDVDLARTMANAWGLESEVVAIGFDSLPDALKAAKIDSIVSAYPYDDRLTRDFAFSTPYFEAGLRLAVRDRAPVTSVEELAGARVAVEWGSVGDMVGRRLQREGMELELVPLETPSAVIIALANDASIDAAFVDNVTLQQAQRSGIPIRGVGMPLESNPYVIVAPIRAGQLQQQIETTLQALKDNGAMQRLETTWFSGAQESVGTQNEP